jgi:SNF2 family DNA or RNA helicase
MAKKPYVAPPLFEHQRSSTDFILSHERALDASDPGTGKTRVQIEAFARRLADGGGKALVIAPKSLLRSAWEDDFRKFAPHVATSVATATNRDKAFARVADVYITNTDAVNWLSKQPAKFFFGFDTLIIDEMSTFKHSTSQRSKNLNKIKKHFRYRYGMTGTPNSNTITDIWHQYFVLDDGQRLGTSFFAFRSATCEPKQIGPQPNMVKWTDKPGIEGAVTSLVKDITVRHRFEDCISIPENHQYCVNYHLDTIQKSKYRTMELAALVNVGRSTVNAVNAAAQITKLLQIASGAVYTDTGEYGLVSTGRYSLICDLVEQREHSIVFFHWKHQRDELIKELEDRKISWTLVDSSVNDKKRHEAVDLFQKGFYRVLLAHPQSAAHGLTLTKGTTTIWSSPTYNLEHWLQGNRRIYRAGQQKRTETIVVIAPGTIEQEVYEKMLLKNDRQVSMLEFLQEYSKQIEQANDETA